MQTVVVALLVVMMMLAIGLRTSVAELYEVWRRPGALLLAFLANLVGMPLVAVALTRVVPLAPEVVVGLLICAVCPGGSTGPMFAGMAGGHLATAVSAMVSLSMVSVLTAPATLALLVEGAGEVDPWPLIGPMMGTLVSVQLVPLLVGMGLRRWGPRGVEAWSGPATRVANLLLLAVIVGLLVTKGASFGEVGAAGITVALALVLAFVGLGALSSPAGPTRWSLALIGGVRNVSLALLISGRWFPAPLIDATILVFGLFAMVVPFGVARLGARRVRS